MRSKLKVNEPLILGEERGKNFVGTLNLRVFGSFNFDFFIIWKEVFGKKPKSIFEFSFSL